MQNTTNYNLNKPDGNDFAKIEALNENADIIDGKLKELEDASSATDERVATHLDNYEYMLTLVKKRLTAYQSASQSIANTTDTTIIYDTVHENDANYFTVHTNGTITVNVNCTLIIKASVAILLNNLSGYIILKAYKNNEYILPSAQIDGLANYSKSLLTDFTIDCVSGDNIDIKVYQYNDGGTPISTDISNYFTKVQVEVKA